MQDSKREAVNKAFKLLALTEFCRSRSQVLESQISWFNDLSDSMPIALRSVWLERGYITTAHCLEIKAFDSSPVHKS